MRFRPTRRSILKSGIFLSGEVILPVQPAQAEKDLRNIAYGETKRGRIDTDDPQFQFKENLRTYAEPISFTGQTGDEVSMTVTGNDLSGIAFALHSPNDNLLAEGYKKKESSVIPGLSDFTFSHHTVLSKSGEHTYWIGVFPGDSRNNESGQPTRTGPYEIALQKVGEDHLLRPNDSIREELSTGDKTSTKYIEKDTAKTFGYSDMYRIPAERERSIEVTVKSPYFKPRMIYTPDSPDQRTILSDKNKVSKNTNGVWTLTVSHTFADKSDLIVIVTSSEGNTGDEYIIEAKDLQSKPSKERDSIDFQQLKSRKMDLAAQITNLSVSIDDERKAKSALDELENLYKKNEISSNLAYNTVERLALGENITESLLAAIGHKNSPSLGDSDDLLNPQVGGPKGAPAANKEYNLLGDYLSFLFNATFAFSIASLTSNRAANKLDDALSQETLISSSGKFSRARKWMNGSFLPGTRKALEPAEESAQQTAGEVFSEVADSGSKGAKRAAELAEKHRTNFAEEMTNNLQRNFEESYSMGTPIGEKLTDFHTYTVQKATQTGELSGSQQGAKDGVKNLHSELRRELRTSEDNINSIQKILKKVDMVGLFLALLEPGPVMEIALLVTTVGGNLWGAEKAWSSIPPAIAHHHAGLDAIANGGWS